jgi:hypothetical protein
MTRSKRKRPQPAQRTKLKQTSSNTLSKKRLFFGYFWKCFVGFAVILGVVVILYPKPTVEPYSYLDPKNPLKTSFKISNDSFLPLYNVKISCAIREVKCKDWPGVRGEDDFTSRLFNPVHVADKLSYGESDTAFCPLGAFDLHSPVDYADIAIIVEFSPPLISKWRIERIFPYITQKNVRGDVVLIPRPVNK